MASSPQILSRVALVFFASAIVALGAHELKRPPAGIKGVRSASREEARRLISDLHGYDLFSSGKSSAANISSGGIFANLKRFVNGFELRGSVSPAFLRNSAQDGRINLQNGSGRYPGNGRNTNSNAAAPNRAPASQAQTDVLTGQDREELDRLIDSEMAQ